MLVINRKTVYIVVYFDDILLLSASLMASNTVADIIGKRLEIRIEKKVTKLLGIIINLPRKGKLKIRSVSMIEHMLEMFNLKNYRGFSSPLAPGTFLTKMVHIDEIH